MKNKIINLTIATLFGSQTFAVSYQARENIHGQMVLVPQQIENAGNATETVLIQVGNGNPPIAMQVPAGCSSLPVLVENTQENTKTVGVREKHGSFQSRSTSHLVSVQNSESHRSASELSIPLLVKKSDSKEDQKSSGFTVGGSQSKTTGKFDETERTEQDKNVKTSKYLYFPCKQ